jgi:hypothetical protein
MFDCRVSFAKVLALSSTKVIALSVQEGDYVILIACHIQALIAFADSLRRSMVNPVSATHQMGCTKWVADIEN